MSRSNPELAKSMGKRIAARRKELQLTQEAVAEMAGITHQQYNKAENGKTCLGSDSLRRISIALQVSADYLLCGEDKQGKHYPAVEVLDKMNDRQLQLAHEVLKCMVLFGEEAK